MPASAVIITAAHLYIDPRILLTRFRSFVDTVHNDRVIVTMFSASRTQHTGAAALVVNTVALMRV